MFFFYTTKLCLENKDRWTSNTSFSFTSVSPFSSNLKSTMLQMIMISLVFGLITLTNAEYQPASAFLKKKVIFFDVLFIFLFYVVKTFGSSLCSFNKRLIEIVQTSIRTTKTKKLKSSHTIKCACYYSLFSL